MPIIAPASGGFPEIVEHGVTGLSFSSGDAEGLASAIEALLAVDIRTRMGKANRARVGSVFTVEAMGRAFIDVLEALA